MEQILELRSAWRNPVGVDEAAGMIRGMVLAEAVPFKTGRGRFDEAALERAAELINEAGGVPSYLSHAHAKGDGEGTYLGEVQNAQVDYDPKPARLRADLKFDPAAALSPLGNWPAYILAQAQSNPRRIGSSLALRATAEEQPPVKGKRQPPLWRPTAIISADIVSRGDAVNSLLSAEEQQELETVPPSARLALLKRLLTVRLNLVRSK